MLSIDENNTHLLFQRCIRLPTWSVLFGDLWCTLCAYRLLADLLRVLTLGRKHLRQCLELIVRLASDNSSTSSCSGSRVLDACRLKRWSSANSFFLNASWRFFFASISLLVGDFAAVVSVLGPGVYCHSDVRERTGEEGVVIFRFFGGGSLSELSRLAGQIDRTRPVFASFTGAQT